MTRQSLATVSPIACLLWLVLCWTVNAAAEDTSAASPAVSGLAADDDGPEPSVRYLPSDALAGMSKAVVVQGHPLVHTRQLLPLDGKGELVGQGAVDEQIEQVLSNLEAVLKVVGSSLDQLVRLNVYALSQQTTDRLLRQLAQRTDPSVRPAVTAILTSLPHREALVAVDAIAIATEASQAVTLHHCDAVFGDKDCADAAVLPRGGVAYLSGQPEKGGLAVSAVTQSLSTLLERLEPLKLSPSHVVQLRVFLSPATSADAALREVKRLFPGQLTPPVVFVEWIASVPVEIEMVAQLPLTDDDAETVEFYDPPQLKPSPAFSRVALVHTERQIYISALSARAAGNGEAQGRDVFEQLQQILDQTGSGMRYLAKATYYVSDDDGSRGIDISRREFFDPERPPAASKVTVHAVGRSDRTLSIDMIAVGSDH